MSVSLLCWFMLLYREGATGSMWDLGVWDVDHAIVLLSFMMDCGRFQMTVQMLVQRLVQIQGSRQNARANEKYGCKYWCTFKILVQIQNAGANSKCWLQRHIEK